MANLFKQLTAEMHYMRKELRELRRTVQDTKEWSKDVNTVLAATNTLARSAQATAEGNTKALAVLSNQVNDLTTGLAATNTLAQSAQATADGNATAITTVYSSVNNAVAKLSQYIANNYPNKRNK